MAISLTTLLLGALGTFFAHSISLTSQERAQETASQVATSTMERLRSLPPSDLLTGSVSARISDTPAAVKPYLDQMNPATVSGTVATVPTAASTPTLNGVTFSVTVYLGRCVMAGITSTTCVQGSTGVGYLRAVTAVSWSGAACGSGTCTFVTSSLISLAADPTFNSSQVPPAKPAVVDPGTQVSTIGSTVSVQLTATGGTEASTMSWQVTSGSLPTGLTLGANGLVTGKPSALTSAISVTVTVTDAFGRSATGTVTWAVVNPPTITAYTAQTATVGSSVSLAAPSSTCPNTPCTFALTNAPPGLSINSTTGAISGTPTTTGSYGGVTVTITDASAMPVTTAGFAWTVLAPPTIGSTGSLTATVGKTATSGAVAYTCPATPCTLTLTGTVPGMGLATSASTTNNTATTLTVTSTSGSIYVTGLVQASAVSSGSSQTYSPTIKITDTDGSKVTSASGTWTVNNTPTIDAPGTRSMTIGNTKNIPFAYTCAATPCTVKLAGSVPGLGLSTTSGATDPNSTASLTVTTTSGTVYVNGTVGSTAVTSGTSRAWSPSVTITDAGSNVASAAGSWTAYTAPTIVYPGSQAVAPNQSLSLQMSAACPDGGCSYSAYAQVSGDSTKYQLPISSSGLISYSNAPTGTYSVVVTATDADGASASTTFKLTVATFTLSIANQTNTKPNNNTTLKVTGDIASLVSPTADGYTYSLSGAPGWLTIDAGTGQLVALITRSSASDDSITLTVTSTASPGSSVSTTFSWTLR